MRDHPDQNAAAGAGDQSAAARREVPRVDRRAMPATLAPPLGWAARLGLIVLASDHTIEYEWREIIERAALAEGGRESVAVYCARIANDPSISAETLTDMERRLTDSADLLLPGVPFDVIAYGCTSASMLIGSDRVAAQIHRARPGVSVTDPAAATCRAFEALGIDRLAMLTPYIPDVNAQMRQGFMARGFSIPVMGSFGLQSDNDAARVDAPSLAAGVRELGADPEVEGVFVSCTSIRLADQAAALEAEIGKPVVSSNLALAWDALRRAGVDASLPGYGRLFTL
ncbi:MAG: Asp/Glu racemase [Marivibrio sp.]|uniref:maleate cis-trans isomerase family protein n=1 Tax=Marivibrio sp. TaxID=2039719 RepID=UPI0032F07EF8